MNNLTRRTNLAGGTVALLSATDARESDDNSAMALRGSMIRHTVAFRLKWPAGSNEERKFFQAARPLAALPNVRRFETLRQISHKTNFDFGFSMEFADESAYASYNNHPVHQAFLREQWVPNVADFMEIDYQAVG